MPPIEMRPLRAVAAIEARTRAADVRSQTAAPTAHTQSAASAADVLDPGAPPVDIERVAEIRKAVESGTYPVIPTRIADAMIATGFLLGTSK
jgi:negative regulator of flagellin synthesis FlgM